MRERAAGRRIPLTDLPEFIRVHSAGAKLRSECSNCLRGRQDLREIDDFARVAVAISASKS